MIDILASQIKKKGLSHSYVIICQDADKAQEKVNKIVQELNISSADKLYFNQASNIKIADIRLLHNWISLKPYLGQNKLAFIKHAELLTGEAANALLKILEEPPKHSIIILVAPEKSKLLPTIVSRCQVIRINCPLEISHEELEIAKAELEKLIKCSISQKFSYIDQLVKDDNPQAITNLLTKWLYLLKGQMLDGQNTPKIIRQIQKSLNLLSSTNVNKKLLLENLILLM